MEPAISIVTAREAGLHAVSDPVLLDRAAADGRVLISHDKRTMLGHFRDHLRAGKPTSGLLVVAQDAPVREVIESIVLLWSLSDPEVLRDHATHLPSLERHVFRW